MMNPMKLHASTALAALLTLTSVSAGCRASGAETTARDETIAECPVCKHEGDLACVCVHVTADTPCCECNGEKFYFCSDECRADFEQHPERYAAR